MRQTNGSYHVVYYLYNAKEEGSIKKLDFWLAIKPKVHILYFTERERERVSFSTFKIQAWFIRMQRDILEVIPQ